MISLASLLKDLYEERWGNCYNLSDEAVRRHRRPPMLLRFFRRLECDQKRPGAWSFTIPPAPDSGAALLLLTSISRFWRGRGRYVAEEERCMNDRL
jgi:hypothetical protein